MYILALETTGPLGSAALLDLENHHVKHIETDAPMSHLRELAVSVKELTKAISMTEIAAVAASVGPGSFTGIRIGVTTARTISQALNKPCISVPTLEIFRLKDCLTSGIAVIFNARRGQVYGAFYAKDEKGDIQDILKPGPYMLTDVFDSIRNYSVNNSGFDGIKFFGDGIDSYEGELSNFASELKEQYKGAISSELAEKKERYQRADLVAEFALKKYEKGEMIDYANLLPDYMRTSEAEQKLADGTLQRLREEKLARLRNNL